SYTRLAPPVANRQSPMTAVFLKNRECSASRTQKENPDSLPSRGFPYSFAESTLVVEVRRELLVDAGQEVRATESVLRARGVTSALAGNPGGTRELVVALLELRVGIPGLEVLQDVHRAAAGRPRPDVVHVLELA